METSPGAGASLPKGATRSPGPRGGPGPPWGGRERRSPSGGAGTDLLPPVRVVEEASVAPPQGLPQLPLLPHPHLQRHRASPAVRTPARPPPPASPRLASPRSHLRELPESLGPGALLVRVPRKGLDGRAVSVPVHLRAAPRHPSPARPARPGPAPSASPRPPHQRHEAEAAGPGRRRLQAQRQEQQDGTAPSARHGARTPPGTERRRPRARADAVSQSTAPAALPALRPPPRRRIRAAGQPRSAPEQPRWARRAGGADLPCKPYGGFAPGCSRGGDR